MTEAERIADRALRGVEPHAVAGTDVEVLATEVEGARIELTPSDRCRRGGCPCPSWKRQVDHLRDLVSQPMTGERTGEADGRPRRTERGLNEIGVRVEGRRSEETATDPLDHPLLTHAPDLPVGQAVPPGIGVAEQFRQGIWEGGCPHDGIRYQTTSI